MKNALFALLAGVAVAALSGCAHNRCNSCCENGPSEKDTHFCVHPIRSLLGIGQGTCRKCPETAAACPTCPQPACHACGGRGCGMCLGHGQPMAEGPVGAVTYPYYTLHGPRDFLAKNPPSMGP